jgi:hypothetical protein
MIFIFLNIEDLLNMLFHYVLLPLSPFHGETLFLQTMYTLIYALISVP